MKKMKEEKVRKEWEERDRRNCKGWEGEEKKFDEEYAIVTPKFSGHLKKKKKKGRLRKRRKGRNGKRETGGIKREGKARRKTR